MNDLIAKLERLVHAKAINIATKEAGRCRHKCARILPLCKQEQPKVGDFCRSIVVGKDEAKKELILHLTFLLEGERATYVNHLKYKGYIRDYDLVKMLATHIEIRILDFHLRRQLQADRPRLGTSRTGQEHRGQG